MAEERLVRIQEWPKEPARLQHTFDAEQPCPVTLSFEDSPANVILHTREPLSVDMRMALTAREDIPLCIKICEPICARSEYTIGIDIFDRPVAAITVRGQTKLMGCDDKSDGLR